ncbi:protein patched isoform X2 [Phlebotomus argentipes]|uniref:protein patched isoform X2 n=1 Tax=Phlebotomus argentipes TaxID=94469 RepID=UPI00289376CD|nr:protein patched isoform X2 [Phlebotomus argentipes]
MHELPRVPDSHGDRIDEKLFSDLYVRTSWVDAATAFQQIESGKARGRRLAVYIRSVLQFHLYSLGCYLQKHAGKVIFVAILVLSSFCVGLKSATIHSKVQQLWIQDGGRLEEELKYTLKSLGETGSSTHQLVIQVSKEPNASILHTHALMIHLEVLRRATAVTVHMFDTTWGLKDMCYSMNAPNFDVHLIEQIFDNIIPCAIITPLDCFWEGSKLLGPEFPVHIPGLAKKLQWSSLNPQHLLRNMEALNYHFPAKTIEKYLKGAGITTGYTEKPCLDVRDPLCPETARNRNSTQSLDIGAELTGGCYGYAAKYMHWPETLITGGGERNKTGHLKKVTALQSVVQLMGEREMYEYWNNHYKVHHVSWSQEKATAVLTAWQKKFSVEVSKIVKMDELTTSYNMFAFSSASLDEVLKKYSNPSPMGLTIGMVTIVVYAGIVLSNFQNPVRSQMGLGIAGVLLMGVSTAAGLGFCALLGISFNAATTQVVPFLALGLSVDHLFLLSHEYSKQSNEEQTAAILKKVGLSVFVSAACTTGSFLAAVLIPVPALRLFCLQAAILLTFNLTTVVIVFPALISLDMRRRRANRIDLLCCCLPPMPEKTLKQHNKAMAMNSDINSECSFGNFLRFSLGEFIEKCYVPFLMKRIVKSCGMTVFAIALAFGLYGTLKLQDGLELTDLVPKNSEEHRFLHAQEKLFGFYSMFAVTQGDFEYPMNQKLLYEYHEAFVRVSHVKKNDNGGLPNFWLGLFRDWLLDLQKAFDKDYAQGKITQERWFANASDDAILAYKLLVQTGHVDNPIDKSLTTQNRLVDHEGIINPKAFYNYLSAWAWNDILAYGASQGNLRPEPREWYHSPSDFELKIPKSAPLTYTQLPFFLHGLHDTTEIKATIMQIREICEKFEARGLPNYPSGIPFTFWEQYMNLRENLTLALGAALGMTFILVAIALLSLWGAFLIVFCVVATLVQLLGMMTLLDIKLSAIPAIILVLSIGLSVCFTIHISLAFITAVGGKDRRVRIALEYALTPVIHGIVTTTLAVVMLSTSPIEFIVRHFFLLLLSAVFIGAVNSLFFFPILLNLIGPAAEIVPLANPNRISTPSPRPCRRIRKSSKVVTMKERNPLRDGSGPSARQARGVAAMEKEPSLTTITEEPHSWQSSASSAHEVTPGVRNITLQPEVTVQQEAQEGKVQTVTIRSSLKSQSLDLETIQLISLTDKAESRNHATPSVVKTEVELVTPRCCPASGNSS